MSPDIDAPPVVWDDKPVNLTADQCMAMDAAKAKGVTLFTAGDVAGRYGTKR